MRYTIKWDDETAEIDNRWSSEEAVYEWAEDRVRYGDSETTQALNGTTVTVTDGKGRMHEYTIAVEWEPSICVERKE